MKKRQVLNICILFVIIFILVSLVFPEINYSKDLGLGDLNQYVDQPNARTPVKFRGMVNTIISIIQTAGSIISVIVLIIIGMRYMFSSVEEKAEYKKTMIGYMIGCIMVFSLVNLLGIIYDIATKI